MPSAGQVLSNTTINILLQAKDAVSPVIKALDAKLNSFIARAKLAVSPVQGPLPKDFVSQFDRATKGVIALKDGFQGALSTVTKLSAGIAFLTFVEYQSIQQLERVLSGAGRTALGIVQQAIATAASYETTVRGVTAQISGALKFSDDPVKQMEGSLALAQDYARKLAEDAARLPGTFQEFFQISLQIQGSILAIRGDMDDVRELVGLAAIAGETLNISLDEMGRGMGFMLRGVTGIDNRLFSVLQSMNYITLKTGEFNRLAPEKRAQVMKEALEKIAKSMKDSDILIKSWSVQSSTFQENLTGVTGVLGTIGQIILPNISAQLFKLNQWFEQNRALIDEIAKGVAAAIIPAVEMLGTGILRALEYLKQVPNLAERIAEFLIEAGIAALNLWLRIKSLSIGMFAFTTALAAILLDLSNILRFLFFGAIQGWTAFEATFNAGFQSFRVTVQALLEYALQAVDNLGSRISIMMGTAKMLLQETVSFIMEQIAEAADALYTHLRPLAGTFVPQGTVDALDALADAANKLARSNATAAEAQKKLNVELRAGIDASESFREIYDRLHDDYVQVHAEAAANAVQALKDTWNEAWKGGEMTTPLYDLALKSYQAFTVSWEASLKTTPLANPLIESAKKWLNQTTNKSASELAKGVPIGLTRTDLDAAKAVVDEMKKLKDSQIKDAIKRERDLTGIQRELIKERIQNIRDEAEAASKELGRLKDVGALKDLADGEYEIIVQLRTEEAERKIKELEDSLRLLTEVEEIKIQVRDLNKEIERGSATATQGAIAGYKEWEMEALNTAKQIQTGVGQLMNQLTSSISGAFVNVIQGTKSWGEAFQEVGYQILDTIIQIITQMLVVAALQAAIGGGSSAALSLFGNEGGGMGALGLGILGLAKGGIVNSPTLSMIGEGASAEAVVPLPDNRSIPVKFHGPSTVAGSSGGASDSGVEAAAPVQINMNVPSVDSADFKRKMRENETFIRKTITKAIQSDKDVRGAIRRVGKA